MRKPRFLPDCDRAQIGDERVDVRRPSCPRSTSAGTAGADEVVETPAAVRECVAVRGLTCGRRPSWPRAGSMISTAGISRISSARRLGHLVGMLGVAEPRADLQQPDPRRGDEPHLREQVAGLLAAELELRRPARG